MIQVNVAKLVKCPSGSIDGSDIGLIVDDQKRCIWYEKSTVGIAHRSKVPNPPQKISQHGGVLFNYEH